MKVLVVDDVRTNRILASRILEKRGHTVKTAESGSEAIEALALEDFDLVLMDIQMPKMSGIETAAFIRNSIPEARCREIVILATSACADSSLINDCIKAGMNGFIAKPISSAELLDMVGKYEKKAAKRTSS